MSFLCFAVSAVGDEGLCVLVAPSRSNGDRSRAPRTLRVDVKTGDRLPTLALLPRQEVTEWEPWTVTVTPTDPPLG
jgi:hypothetical protein